MPYLHPHLSVRPRSSRTDKRTSHSQAVPVLTPQGVHTTSTATPVSHGVWKMPLPTLLTPPHGFAVSALLHSPHSPERVPSAQRLGPGCRGPGKEMLSSSSFGCSISMCSASPSPMSSAHLGWGEQELVAPWSFLHIAMLNTLESSLQNQSRPYYVSTRF